MTTLTQAMRSPEPRLPAGRRGYAHWRAATLIGVHVLIGLHIAHWLVAGRTLAPLEFNEVMYTLELGVVTAGFLLMATAVVATAIFGRFFCGWACHILALQDLCAWLLRRLGIEARPIRSRTLRVAPFAVMGYMFVWPQVARLLRGAPAPELHVAGSDQAWASFVTDDFWRNLPGPWIAGLTFLICGFVIVYVLGTRAFCRNACPYGAVFALADRLAPGRIRLRGSCSDCGKCTAVCQSGIWVHEEVQRFGTVVDPACLRDLDCVAACPDEALAYGFGRPAGFASLVRTGRKPRRHPWPLLDDLLAGAVMLLTILVFRGLYGTVPFLMAVGLGCVAAGSFALAQRLWRERDLRWRGLALRRGGRWTRAGFATAAAIAALFAFTLESGWVRWHEWRGAVEFAAARRAIGSGRDATARASLAAALHHHEAVERWGLWNPLDHDRRLASLYALEGDAASAAVHLERVVAAATADHEARLRFAFALVRLGRHAEVAAHLRALLDAAQAGTLPAPLAAGAAECAEELAAKWQRDGDAAGAAEPARIARELRAVLAR